MANKTEVQVTTDWLDLADHLSLTDGETYLVQHIGGDPVQFCDSATNPTGSSLGVNLVDVGQWFEFDASTAEPTWVRARANRAKLAVKDG